MYRDYQEQPGVTVAADKDDSGNIDLRNAAGGRFGVPAGSSITTITWYESFDGGDTFLACQDGSGAAVTQTVSAGNSYPFPDSLYASGLVRAEGDAAGTIDVVRKS